MDFDAVLDQVLERSSSGEERLSYRALKRAACSSMTTTLEASKKN